MPLSVNPGGWSRAAQAAVVLLITWLCWPLGLALAAALAWLGSRQAAPARLRGNPFDRFWRRVYRIGSAGDDPGAGGETPPDPGEEEREFAEYLERLRRAQDGVRIEPIMPGRDRAGFA